MTVTTFSSREFNQRTSEAKQAAEHGPVFITDRGQPSYVLLNIAQYHRLTGGAATIDQLLAMPDAADIEFDPPRAKGLARPADLS